MRFSIFVAIVYSKTNIDDDDAPINLNTKGGLMLPNVKYDDSVVTWRGPSETQTNRHPAMKIIIKHETQKEKHSDHGVWCLVA